MKIINSQQWWDEYFETQWEKNCGKEQTAFFMQLIVDHLPDYLKVQMNTYGISILDWGCGMGQGVDILKKAFPNAYVSGLDFSVNAIEKCQDFFPDYSFTNRSLSELNKKFSIIICSNVLEHLSDPFKYVNEHLSYCEEYYIILVPYDEKERIESHINSFNECFFPDKIKDFYKIFQSIIDVRDSRFWYGYQLLVVYINMNNLQKIMIQSNKLQELEKIIIEKNYEILNLEEKITQIELSLSWQMCQIYGKYFQENSIVTKMLRFFCQNLFFKTLKKDTAPSNEDYKKDLDIILSENKEKVKGIIIYPPTVDWNVPLFQRPQQLALELSKLGYLFFYCSNNSYDKVNGFSKINEHLILTDQFSLLINELHDFIFLFHAAHPSITISDIQKMTENNQDIFLIYEYIDEISEKIFGKINIDIFKRHDYMLKTADVIITSADSLYADVLKRRDNDVYLVPNGVDYTHFHIKRDNSLISCDLKEIIEKRKPIIGYFGALASWFDYELVKYLAINRPEYQIVLIGWNYDHTLDISGIDQINNIHYLGVKEYPVLPKYAIWFDVSIIPFVLNEITKSTSPIKIFEYMALGTPIVTTELDECKKYKSVLIGKNYQEFLVKIDEAIQLRSDNQYLSLLDYEARENTWEMRANAINNVITKNYFKMIYRECQREVGRLVKNQYYLTDYQKVEENYYKPILRWIIEDRKLHHIERILDIGCAYGTLLLFAQKLYNCKCYAIDNSEAYLSKEIIDKYDIEFKKQSIENHELPWNLKFDRIIFTDTIEHLFNPFIALNNIYSLLKDGGKLFISTPDASEWGRITKYYSNFKEIIEKPKINDIGIDDHIFIYTVEEITELLDKSNFKVEKISYSPGCIYRNINLLATKK